MGTRLRKYGVQATIDFEVYGIDGVDLKADWVPAQVDCEIMKDGGASTLCDNTATDEGVTFSIVLTATEMEFARGVLKIQDAATKVILDTVVHIETYGNASAMHAIDLGTALASQTIGTCTTNTDLVTAAAIKTAMEAEGTSDLDAIADAIAHATYGLSAIRTRGDAAWAGAPESVSGTIAVATADTIFDLTATLGTLSTADDTYNNMIICILDNSGSVYETARITDYDGTGLTRVTIDHELTFPVEDGVDTFVIYRAAYAPVGAASITEGDMNTIVDKVHDELVSEHQTAGSAGYHLKRAGQRY